MTTAVRARNEAHSERATITGTVLSWLAPATAGLSITTLVLIAAIGGWMRRWISDDGLIVLRTVRNLLAGNGPVFNAGERVEANTSTLWQYLIYVGALVTDARLEAIAMWLALGFTVLGVGIGAAATARLHAHHVGILLVPCGGLVYLALPPARDFATSGLEWGLSIFWMAVQWALLVWWARSAHTGFVVCPEGAGRGRHRADDGPGIDWPLYLLAFWSGLSWLVRPELALYGGLTGIVLLISARRFGQIAGILIVALPMPAAYQIFRMGYYGLLTPHTAVAKSATDSQWAAGGEYLLDLTQPYFLLVAAIGVLGAAAALLWRHSLGETAVVAPVEALGRERVRGPFAINSLIVGAALLHFLYVLRVGGDFMHGRMWLVPLFAILLPVFVLPVIDVQRRHLVSDLVVGVAGVVVAVWAVVVMQRGTAHVDWNEFEGGDFGIVDEREFWSFATERDHGDPPQFAQDFLPAGTLGDWREKIAAGQDDKAAQLTQIVVASDPVEYSWLPVERLEEETDLRSLPMTAYHVNLGMTSMNAPLNVRVLDTIGLTTPLAARQPRAPDGRIGHDKALPRTWQAADTAADLSDLPPWIDAEKALAARAALRTPDMAELIATYREPMSTERFLRNLGFSLGPGRSLDVPADPEELLDADTIALLEDAVEDGQESHPELVDTGDSPRIAWPFDIHGDAPR